VKKAQSKPATTEGDDEKAEKTRRIKALMIETGMRRYPQFIISCG